jgi:DNA/RNA endonuclease YhcR with UshA esterase domain
MKIYIAFLLFGLIINSSDAQTISASQAKDNVGKNVTVCDQVFSVIHATNVNREPTFLDYGAKYPNMIFAVVIWGDDLSKFSYSLKTLEGKNICVTGTITLYKGRPEIIIHEPGQIKLK